MIKRILHTCFALLLMVGSVNAITKAQGIALLEAKFQVVGTPILVQGPLPGYNVTFYQVPVLSLTKDSVASGRTIQFYVIDEGDAGEAAYIGKRLNVPSDNPLVAAVKVYIDAQGFKLVGVTEAYPADNWAIALIYELDGGGTFWIKKSILLEKSGPTVTHKDVQ